MIEDSGYANGSLILFLVKVLGDSVPRGEEAHAFPFIHRGEHVNNNVSIR